VDPVCSICDLSGYYQISIGGWTGMAKINQKIIIKLKKAISGFASERTIMVLALRVE
jgi:hypothetical protein